MRYLDVYAIPIPGWGMSTGRSEEGSTGWLIFIRGGSEGALKSLYDWYLQEIVVPFVTGRRQEHPFNWREGTPIPEWMRCVVWLDGEMSQLHGWRDVPVAEKSSACNACTEAVQADRSSAGGSCEWSRDGI